MIELACGHIGHSIASFDLYRFRLQYPPLHACVLTQLVKQSAAQDGQAR